MSLTGADAIPVAVIHRSGARLESTEVIMRLADLFAVLGAEVDGPLALTPVRLPFGAWLCMIERVES